MGVKKEARVVGKTRAPGGGEMKRVVVVFFLSCSSRLDPGDNAMFHCFGKNIKEFYWTDLSVRI